MQGRVVVAIVEEVARHLAPRFVGNGPFSALSSQRFRAKRRSSHVLSTASVTPFVAPEPHRQVARLRAFQAAGGRLIPGSPQYFVYSP